MESMRHANDLSDNFQFNEVIERELYEYRTLKIWYSIQGEGGQDVMESESWIDKKHLEYWDECIDNDSQVDMNMEVSMIPKCISDVMMK